MHAEHIGCGDLAIMPDDEWRCKTCTHNLTLWERGMHVMVRGKSIEQKDDPPNEKLDGPRLGMVGGVRGLFRLSGATPVSFVLQGQRKLRLASCHQRLNGGDHFVMNFLSS